MEKTLKEGGGQLFSGEKQQESNSQDKLIEELYHSIGELKVANDFLKKKLKGVPIWAIDITYIPMEKGLMYLFAIIDLYSRYVVGWSLSNTMSPQWCVDAIEQAIAEHGKPEILNSDQGTQFASDIYTEFLKANEIRISMDGKGRAIDNVFIERLWRNVKYEHLYLHVYQTGNELWHGLENYFPFS